MYNVNGYSNLNESFSTTWVSMTYILPQNTSMFTFKPPHPHNDSRNFDYNHRFALMFMLNFNRTFMKLI